MNNIHPLYCLSIIISWKCVYLSCQINVLIRHVGSCLVIISCNKICMLVHFTVLCIHYWSILFLGCSWTNRSRWWSWSTWNTGTYVLETNKSNNWCLSFFFPPQGGPGVPGIPGRKGLKGPAVSWSRFIIKFVIYINLIVIICNYNMYFTWMIVF